MLKINIRIDHGVLGFWGFGVLVLEARLFLESSKSSECVLDLQSPTQGQGLLAELRQRRRSRQSPQSRLLFALECALRAAQLRIVFQDSSLPLTWTGRKVPTGHRTHRASHDSAGPLGVLLAGAGLPPWVARRRTTSELVRVWVRGLSPRSQGPGKGSICELPLLLLFGFHPCLGLVGAVNEPASPLGDLGS